MNILKFFKWYYFEFMSDVDGERLTFMTLLIANIIMNILLVASLIVCPGYTMAYIVLLGFAVVAAWFDISTFLSGRDEYYEWKKTGTLKVEVV